MTTIAYKDGVIAYDSRCTQGDYINSDEYNKRIDRDGVHFFVAGKYSDSEKRVDAYFGQISDVEESTSIYAIVVDKGYVYAIGLTKEDGFWKDKAENPEAMGSGSRHAITAMDCGLSPQEAVRMAMKRDTATGGRVRTFKVKERNKDE